MRNLVFRISGIAALTAIGFACSESSFSGGPSDSDGGGPSNVSSKGVQQNGACPTSASELSGTGGAGTSCTTFAECMPSCCACSVGSRAYLGAACINGKCADKADTCFRAKGATFCPEDPIEADGGTSDGGKSDGGTVPDPSCDGPVDGCWQTCIAQMDF